MANKTLTINYTIPVGSYLKLGYRPIGTDDPFTYVIPQPFYNQSPYSLVVSDEFMYEFELSTICGSCDSGGNSTPIYIQEELPG